MSKRDQTFNYLEALLILMVIDDHVGSRIGFLSSIFPYDSFFMPAFVMISGYFYKTKPVKEYLIKKIKTIYLPYMVWSVIGEVTAFALAKADIVYWYNPLTIKNIAKQLMGGSISSITGAGWFAVMLFTVSVLYNMVDRSIMALRSKERTDNGISGNAAQKIDYLLLVVLLILGESAIWCCMNHINTAESFTVFFRTLFYLQFFHVGCMFRRYWMRKVQFWNRGLVCLFCIAVNVILLSTYGNSIRFPSTARMVGFNSWYLPIITSITGGLFWYEIMAFLAEKIDELKWVSFIAENTFTIMMVHLAFTNVPNFVAATIGAKGFNLTEFQSSAWYTFTAKTRLIGFFFGLAGSLLCATMVERLKKGNTKSK